MSDLKSQMRDAYSSHALPFFRAVCDEGETYAIRALYRHRFIANREGLFTAPADMAREAVAASFEPMMVWDRGTKREAPHHPFGVYLIPNPARAALAARGVVGELAAIEETDGIKDHEVARRTCLLIDLDSVKDPNEEGKGVSGICATDAERDCALRLAEKVRAFLTSEGWAAPIMAMTGNGVQLTYRFEAPNDKATSNIVEAVTKSLAARFSGEGADVDDAVFNAARLWRVPGTWNRKGRDTEERPHRLCELLDAPVDWRTSPVSVEQLTALVEQLGVPAALKLIGRAQPVPSRALAPRTAAPPSPALPEVPPALSQAPAAAAPAGTSEAAIEAAKSAMLADTSWVKDALDAIDVAAGRGQWLSCGRAVKGILGEAGWEVWRAWSETYGGTEQEDRKAWDSIAADADPDEGCRMLLGIAKKYGWSYKVWREANRVRLKVDRPAQAAPPRAAAPPPPPPPERPAGLHHPLARHWLTYAPVEMQAEALLCVADSITRQLTTVAEPVRLGPLLLVCDPDTCRWHEVGPGDVAQILRGWLNTVLVTSACNKEREVYYAGKASAKKVFDEVLTCAPDVTRIRQGQGAQLVLTDGVLRWRDGKMQLEPLAPEHYATYGYDLPARAIEGAACPRWLEYLSGLFPGSVDPDMTVEYLLRWIALAVFGATITFQAPALILKGRAGTGKSTLGKIIERLMPRGSTCSVPLQEWEHEYARAALVGKLFNFVPELAIDEPIGGLDQVKKIIFGEITSARQIYSEKQSFYPQAAHLFCGNGLPNMRKADPAVFKRFVQLEVTGRVVRGTAGENTEFDRELVEAELPGILASLCAAFERAAKDRQARTPGTINGLPALRGSFEANEEWRAKSDAVAVFLSEDYVYDADLKTVDAPTVEDLYKQFKLWCHEAGYALMNRGSFGVQLANFFEVRMVRGGRRAIGCRRRPGPPDPWQDGGDDEP